jgi:hypothetical protein
LALRYENLNDHGQLRADQLFTLLSDKSKLEDPLASKSALSRLELTHRSLNCHMKSLINREQITVTT